MGLFDKISTYFAERMRMGLEQKRLDAEASARFYETLTATENEVNALSIEEARAQLEYYISNTSFLLPEMPGAAPEATSRLGPCLRELFSRYHRISVDNGSEGGCYASVELMDMEDMLPGLIPIGSAEEAECFAVYPGEDALRYWDGSDSAVDIIEQSYPSVYHWLLYEVRLQEQKLADKE